MARLNLEDDIKKDPRFWALVRLLNGDVEKALGKLAMFWDVAQSFWAQDKALVPEDRFRHGDKWEFLIAVDLAERRPEGIYARGAEERFKWYLELCQHNRKNNQKRKKEAHPGPGRGPSGATPGPLYTLSSSLPTESNNSTPEPDPPSPDGVPPADRGPEPSVFDLLMADKWADHAKTVIPSIKVHRVKWAAAMRQLRELEGMTEAEVEALFVFIRKDDFWRPNAVSPLGLRQKSKNGLRKLDNIRLRMREAKPSPKQTRLPPLITLEDLT